MKIKYVSTLSALTLLLTLATHASEKKITSDEFLYEYMKPSNLKK